MADHKLLIGNYVGSLPVHTSFVEGDTLTLDNYIRSVVEAGTLYFKTYNSDAERQADSELSSADIGRLVLQSDNNTVWMLVEATTPIWKQVITSDYASAHAHTGYAATSHTHSEYSLTGHTHDLVYPSFGDLSDYSLTTHTHSEYSLTSHNHSGSYAPIVHSHTEYAATAHNHDTNYAALSHAHNSIYMALASSNNISAQHNFLNGSNHHVSSGESIPLDITLDGSALSIGAIVIDSSNSAQRGDSLVRWGLYAEHASYGAVIGVVPKGISYGGVHARVKDISTADAHCYVANIDKTTGTGHLFYGSSQGSGSLINIEASNASATHAVNVVTVGSGHAANFTQNGTGRGVMSYVGANGDAAFYAQVGTGNTDTANSFLMYGLQQGLGPGARFDVTNASNAQHGLRIRHYGTSTSWLGELTHFGSGHGLYVNVPVGNEGLRVAQGNANINNGNLYVSGTVTKAGGTFLIDHPLDPYHKTLSHSFMESPDMKNVYDGVLELDGDGRGTVYLPDYFEVLNRDFRYQLTAIGLSMPNLFIEQEVNNNQFVVAGGVSNGKVAWQITGIRQDKFALANPIIVEQVKEEPGYIHPVLFE